jgi:hypothetical protein
MAYLINNRQCTGLMNINDVFAVLVATIDTHGIARVFFRPHFSVRPSLLPMKRGVLLVRDGGGRVAMVVDSKLVKDAGLKTSPSCRYCRGQTDVLLSSDLITGC